MDSFIYSINVTIPIFLVMIIGKVIKQLGIINDNFVNVANKYVFKVALPFLLFKNISEADMQTNFDWSFVLYCAVTTIVFFGITWILTEIFMKDEYMKGSFIQCACRSSAAILGMAFIQNMYSDTGMAPLMIVASVPLFNIFSVIILTVKAHPQGESSDDRGNNKNRDVIKKSFINILKNPIIIGIMLGLPFSIFGITIPAIAQKTIASVAQTATPLALLVIGAGFEGSKAIKKIKPTIIATFIKLVLICGAFIPIAIYMGFRNQELVAILIMLASPTTATSYIMAKNMDNDEVLASSVIVLTTLLSSVTLTGWIYLLKIFSLI